jgi:hypothetical protein
MRNLTKRRKGKAPALSFSWEPTRRTRVILLLCFIALFAAIRFRLRDMPLERDEGEYAYAGQLILEEVPPYELAYNMKLPGTYAAYAVMMAVLGQTPSGIHIGLLLVNAATTVLVYLLSAELFGSLAGLAAAASYALLSTSASVMGLAAHATHFVMLAAMAGLVILLRAVERKQYWLYVASGILLGLAFVMKQPGIFFGLFGALFVIKSEWAWPVPWRSLLSRLGAFVAGMLLPYALTCAILWRAGVFQKFWFWTVSYAGQYGTINGLGNGAEQFLKSFPGVIEHSLLIWIVAAVGITALWWHAAARRHWLFVLGFLVFSFLAVCPGFYFRSHYFILMLPAVSLLTGIAVRAAFYGLGERTNSGFIASLPALAFLVVFAIVLFSQNELLFDLDPYAATRFIYGAQPFEQALTIGDYIRDHSLPGDRVAVLGSEPEIYFYAHRHSATGYIYTYPLMEPQAYALKMQNEMISEIESAQPKFVVMVWFPVSWLRRDDSNDHILDWLKEYLKSHYDVVGLANLQDDEEHTVYRWDEEARSYNTHSPFIAYVLRRHG